MKLVLKSVLVAFFATLLFSCSSDSASSGSASFKVNNETFNLMPSSSIILLNQDLSTQGMKRTSITVTGMQGTTKIATVSFDLFRKPNESLSGTYSIYDVDNASSDDIETYVQNNTRACLGWTSSATISVNSTQSAFSANNPDPAATITVVDHGNNSISVTFNGNYRLYDDNFNVSGTMPVQMNITGTAFSN